MTPSYIFSAKQCSVSPALKFSILGTVSLSKRYFRKGCEKNLDNNLSSTVQTV